MQMVLEGIKAVAWKLAQGVLFSLLVCLGVTCTAPVPWKGRKEDEAAEGTPLADPMEEEALKSLYFQADTTDEALLADLLADLQQARLQNEKETQAAFEAWAEHFFPLLTPERQAKAGAEL